MFADSKENIRYRDKVRGWLQEHAPAFSGASRHQSSLAQDLALGRAWQKLKTEHGYSAIAWPRPYGQGGSEAQKLIFSEEEMRYSLPVGYFDVSFGMPIPIVLKYGTEEQKQRFVPPAIRGDTIWAQLFSEPSAGSDLGGVRLRAQPDGGEWILNGQKIWSTWAHIADYGVLVARNDPAAPKHKGLTYFFVDLKSPGVEVRSIRRLSGVAEFGEVFFTDVRVPDSQRFGPIGGGFGVALDTLMIERYAVSDDACWGVPLKRLIELAGTISLNGRPAIKDAGVRRLIAEIYTEERGLAAIYARALAAITDGRAPGPEGAIRKLLAANKRQRMAALALDLLGPSGVLCDPRAFGTEDFAMSWLDAPAFRVAGGTDQMLRNTIAERILGLPQDHRPDKGVPFNQIPV
jgi:alkylation response protein AidB-like acyl-CoA dehydrogenase